MDAKILKLLEDEFVNSKADWAEDCDSIKEDMFALAQEFWSLADETKDKTFEELKTQKDNKYKILKSLRKIYTRGFAEDDWAIMKYYQEPQYADLEDAYYDLNKSFERVLLDIFKGE